MQRQCIYVHRRSTDFFVGPHGPICFYALGNLRGRSFGISIKFGTDGHYLAIGVIDGHTCQVLAIAKSLDEPSELAWRTVLNDRLHGLLQTLCEDLGASFEISAQSSLFRADLVPRHDEGHDGNGDG